MSSHKNVVSWLIVVAVGVIAVSVLSSLGRVLFFPQYTQEEVADIRDIHRAMRASYRINRMPLHVIRSTVCITMAPPPQDYQEELRALWNILLWQKLGQGFGHDRSYYNKKAKKYMGVPIFTAPI